MKKSHKMNHLVIDPNDHHFLNHKEDFEACDFEYDKKIEKYMEAIVDYLNRIRIEWVSYRYNGEPKKSYKPEVAAKINYKKDEKLAKKERRAWLMMEFANIKPKKFLEDQIDWKALGKVKSYTEPEDTDAENT